ncbi:hypothetical protein [Hymenobacter oligotrophus]|nr:hypothetical protein [Hymenobacter oligotrophus]
MIPIWRVQTYITKQRANRIIDRLELFRKERGHYPDSLATLVPAYLPNVPSTAEGLLKARPFVYRVPPNSAFPGEAKPRATRYLLAYYAGTMVDVSYDSATGQWQAED